MKPETRTFRANSMAEALAQVKRHFGPEAVILSTRSMPRGRLLGSRARQCVEITAAADDASLPPFLGRRGVHSAGPTSHERQADAAPASTRSAAAMPETVLTELGGLRILVGELVREARRSRVTKVPEALYATFLGLVQNEVAEQIAEQVIDRISRELPEGRLRENESVRARLAAILEEMLPTSGPIRVPRTGKPVVVALIGPTGVGKTTTAAKLAAHFQLREQRRVGLITLDTYRIAAVEQLRTYAEIIEIPLDVVSTPDQLRDAVERQSDKDVVLIDTAGRSQRDAVKISDLKRFFTAVRPHEVHLVLSSTAGPAVLNQTIEAFQEVGFDRIMFTKLDESIGFGVILGCLGKAKARLSYVTTGQDVPDDIAVADPKLLAGLIAGGLS